jgi:NAD(P)-dependent dehydrogenase (short-subunit alcohol dehydrogenase family)
MASVRDLFDLSGRVSVVTGGATGLGLQMATALAESGSTVVICSRKLENCEEAAQGIEKLGVKALGLAADVTKPDQVEAVKDATLKKFGRVDVLVNNVNCICPGFFVTLINQKRFERNSEPILREIPLGRTGGENDLKGIVVLLGSDASNFIAGAIIPVDGGRWLGEG